MDTIRIDDLRQLANLQDAPAISIYLPTHLAPDARQDGIRLKNLLGRAQDELEARGMRRSEAEQFLVAARNLPGNAEFWKGLSQGLAIFVTPKLFRAYRLPLEFTESLTVHRRPNIKPLLPVADRGERFLLLALSQNHVRLLDVTRSRFSEVFLKGLPQNKRQALNLDCADRGEQVHDGMRGNLGKQAGIFHGQGSVKDTAKTDLTQYFQAMNRALEPLLRKESAPLLLAGVDYLLPLFRQTSSYPHLVERHLDGNCELLSNEQLSERGWEIMRPVFDRSRRESLERFRGLIGTGKASADAAEVTRGALAGKVDVLFAAVDKQQWGRLDSNQDRVTLCDQSCDGSEELVNLAAAETLLRGGTVFAVDPRELPDVAAIAAIYRY